MMKYLLLSVLIAIGIVSCQKEITDEVSGTGIDTTILTDTGRLEADIDSVHWVANGTVKAIYAAADTNGLPPFLEISAISTDGRLLEIGVIDSIVRTNTYDLYAIDSIIANSAAYSDSSSRTKGTFYSNDSIFTSGIKVGTVSITGVDTVNKTITGTFSLKVGRSSDRSTRSFTNGKFTKISYTKTSNYLPGTGTDSFHVKINDTLFVPYTLSIANAGSVSLIGYDSLIRKNVAILFSPTITPGIYTFKSSTPRGEYEGSDTSHHYVSIPDSGRLEILENNPVSKRVRANFSFIALRTGAPSDSAKLTEGYFSVEVP